MSDLIQSLLGCAWGRVVTCKGYDPTPCQAQAFQIVMLHSSVGEHSLKLCEYHRDIVVAETMPHSMFDDE